MRCNKMTGGVACGRLHHKLLHGSANAYCMANAVGARQCQPLTSRLDLFTGEVWQRLLHGTRGTIFEFVTAGVVAPEGNEVRDQIVFVDPGSNVNFIRKDLARRLGLTATPTYMQIKVLNEDFSDRKANVYQLGLRDRF